MSTLSSLKQLLSKLRNDPELLNLSDQASVLRDVGLDSLELLNFMLEIEGSLGLKIDYEHLNYDHLESLSDFAAFLDAS
jgi:acyl carrier protein